MQQPPVPPPGTVYVPARGPVWQQQTYPLTTIPATQNPMLPVPPITAIPSSIASVDPIAPTPLPDPLQALERIAQRKRLLRFIIPAIILVLAFVLYMVWHLSFSPATPVTSSGSGSTLVTQQNFTGTSSTATTGSTTSGATIQVYVVGAVKHPGVYTLATGARVFQLIQAAGGTLPQADLVALNLAAKLNDGQEVYVTKIGEIPPSYIGGVSAPSGTSATGSGQSGQLVNINTATADDLRLNLHVSSTTAQNIITYRVQHGNYTSVDQLLQAVSRSIYDKIKGMVSIS